MEVSARVGPPVGLSAGYEQPAMEATSTSGRSAARHRELLRWAEVMRALLVVLAGYGGQVAVVELLDHCQKTAACSASGSIPSARKSASLTATTTKGNDAGANVKLGAVVGAP